MLTIRKYFPNLNAHQLQQFDRLDSLYREWNGKINLISRKDIESLYMHHVLHSLAIAKVIEFVPGTLVLDVGTGGGFPGIPLAILFPDTHFTLNDSIAKKIKVVNEISSELGLKNITGLNCRAEDINDSFDFVVSRAVTSFPQFHAWVKGKFLKENKNLLNNGILYLKGGELDAELMNFKNRIKIFELKNFFSEEFFETKKIIYFS